jgi:hypothetical protein
MTVPPLKHIKRASNPTQARPVGHESGDFYDTLLDFVGKSTKAHDPATEPLENTVFTLDDKHPKALK